MRATYKNRLAHSMAIQTITAALLIASFMGIIGFNYNLYELKQQRKAEIQGLAQSTLPSFNMAAFSFNEDFQNQLIHGLLNHPNIAGIVIANENGIPFAEGQQPTQCQLNAFERFFAEEQRFFIYPLEFNGFPLGKLIITADNCSFLYGLYQIIWQILSYSIVFSLFVSAFIFYIFYKNVTHPLTALVNFLTDITKDNLAKTDLSRLQTAREDELGLLNRQFLNLLTMLNLELKRTLQSERTIQEYSHKLEALINKRTSALDSLKSELDKNEEKNKLQLHIKEEIYQLTNTLKAPLLELTESFPAESDQVAFLLHLVHLVDEIQHAQKSRGMAKNNLLSLSQLCKEKLSLPSISLYDISFIYDLDEQVFLPAVHIQSLLTGLLSNAIFYHDERPILLHLYAKEDHIILDLSSQGFKLNDADLQPMLMPNSAFNAQNPSVLGFGFLQALCRLMGGSLQLQDFNLEGQTLRCTLPYLPLQGMLENILQHFTHKHPLVLWIENSLWRHQLQELLHHWQIPYSARLENEQQILMTDQALHNHNPELTFFMQPELGEWPDESQILSYLLLLIKRHQQAYHSEMRILLVSNNSVDRMLCEQILQKLGTQLDIAKDGRSAISKSQENDYDLIFMDCYMPSMSGFEASYTIRQNQRNAHTPIIALSGSLTNEEQQRCLVSGMNDFIKKPYSPSKFTAAMKQWLETPSAQ